jgi:nitrate/TMAO reductase-like tetraheme cytochrome c subunit
VRHKLPGSARLLQHLSLLIGLVLLIAAKGFIVVHPALAAVLVFVFSLPYLVVAVVSRRAYFLYGTMLFGAVSYFYTCYALGAPGASFPLLAVALVICLLIVGHHLRKRLSPELRSYPITVFRAMNITVAVFAAWALVQISGLQAQPGFLRHIAGLAFLGFAGVYLYHSTAGMHALYLYVFSMFLAVGAGFLGASIWSIEHCWVFLLAAAALIVFVGTKYHRARTLRWSQHLFYCFGAVLACALVLSLFRWSFLLLDLAITAVLLWQAYRWFSRAVGDLSRATTDERLVPRFFVLGALLLSLPVVPTLFVRPASVEVDAPGLILGLLFSWVAWTRRNQLRRQRIGFVALASLFLAGGLAGLGSRLPGGASALLPLVGALLVMLGLGVAYRKTAETTGSAFQRSLCEAGVLPAVFAWHIPLLLGKLGHGGVSGAIAVGASVVAARLTGNPLFLVAAGPAAAGVVIAASMVLGGSVVPAWAICVVASALGGAWASWAEDRGRHLLRQSAILSWFALSVAGVVLASAIDTTAALQCLAAVGLISALLVGLRRGSREYPDPFAYLVPATAVLATVGAVLLTAVGGVGPVISGISLLVPAFGFIIAWGLSRGTWSGRAASGLFALGMLLVILGTHQDLGASLLWAAAVVGLLFAVAALARGRFPDFASSCAVVGHTTGAVMASASLILAWQVTARLAVAASMIPYVLLYALMPGVRRGRDFRIGTICWLSLTALFGLAAYRSTAYSVQIIPLTLLAALWVAIGYLLQRSGRRQTWSLPLYVSAALVALVCGGISLAAPSAATGSWVVFLLCGLVFVSLFLLLRENLFAYLVSLSLALMGYDWVRLSTSHFTQDVLFYLVIGLGVLGVLLLLPHLKRLAIRLAALPLFSIFTWQGALLVSAAVVAAAGLLAGTYAIRLTLHPKFCIMCHNMAGYYESWQHSSHKDVGCVECHYEPGVKAHVKGKIGATVQVAKFLTHAYGGEKPHSIVSNQSCMRAGCHSEMDHSEETLLYHGKIRFRHDKHLGEHPRGKELNCVSCHGQMVRGQHIGVARTTCLTCHFYGRGEKPVAVGDCQTCHRVPEEPVTFMDQSFDHQGFLAGNESVQCVQCHSQVTQGDGAISMVRCRSCHLDGDFGEIPDQEEFHLAHVSEGHFDCLQCHDEVKHEVRPMTHQLMSSSTDCATCHGARRHTVQERMYAGAILPDAEPVPDLMYSAGVTCDGCHTDVQFVRLGESAVTTRVSGAKQCADCHGDEAYGEMLAEWQDETRARLDELQEEIEVLTRLSESSRVRDDVRLKAQNLLDAAYWKVMYVIGDGSYGVHNYMYVSEILDAAESELKECRSLVRR